MIRDMVLWLLCCVVACTCVAGVILLTLGDDTPARQPTPLVCKCPEQAPGRACDCEDPFGEASATSAEGK